MEGDCPWRIDTLIIAHIRHKNNHLNKLLLFMTASTRHGHVPIVSRFSSHFQAQYHIFPAIKIPPARCDRGSGGSKGFVNKEIT